MVPLGIRAVTNAESAQEIWPQVHSKACVAGKVGSVPRLRQKEGLPGIVPLAQGTPDPHSGVPGGGERVGQVLIAEGITFLQSVLFQRKLLFDE